MTASCLRHLLLLFLAVLVLVGPVAAQEGNTRLKDLVMIQGATPIYLTGYGIVVGLDRTGDRARGKRGSPYTVQSIANMLQRFNITVDPEFLSARNVAAVMVTAEMDPFQGPGTRFDVTVSSLGDAKSLSGGMLLETPLLNPTTGEAFAIAQGPISTSSVLASTLGSTVKSNHTNTGRVPGGALVTRPSGFTLAADSSLGLVLKRPDFTNATRIAESINTAFPGAATVGHAGLIEVEMPAGPSSPSSFLAAVEALTVRVDVPARFVINERTGTIVAGGNVRVSEVMITYGSMVITTEAQPFVSQPPALSGGETVVGVAGSASIEEEGTRSIVFEPNTDVNQLAAALNELGLTARDVIAIFQAIDRAGALQGELVIL